MNVKFVDASTWITLEWFNSGGTRAKRVLQSPEGDEWYFKRSEKKPAKDNKPEKHYKYEFWSEIIAYQIGKMLGLDILKYDIAIHEGEIGCISPLMIKRDEEQLIEVGRYMTALNPAFLPEDYTTRQEYTFRLLEQTIKQFNLAEYWNLFFQTLLFDAIIGNTDRHQENWAFLGKNIFKADVLFTNLVSMAPIYDNGSSLGRELTDQRILELLNSESELLRYVNNGKAEVHWDNKKLTHFNLIENLLNSSYLQQIITASSFLSLWDESKVNDIVKFIDNEVPDDWRSYCIPQSRKNLIFKLLILRSEKLRGLINDRIR